MFRSMTLVLLGAMALGSFAPSVMAAPARDRQQIKKQDGTCTPAAKQVQKKQRKQDGTGVCKAAAQKGTCDQTQKNDRKRDGSCQY